MVGPAAGFRRRLTGRPGRAMLRAMKVRNSLRSLLKRHRANRLARRRGRLFIINKVNRRFKARQG